MWTPNQLLSDETVKALRDGGFSDLKIEFLGWLSYTAKALSNSRNPVKAAHTLLASTNSVKMMQIFQTKKRESVQPKERPDHDAIDQEFARLEKWIQQVGDDTHS